MVDHTDTRSLIPYTPNDYPSLGGGEALFLTSELRRLSNSVNQLVAVVKLLEDRMNDNALT